MIIRSLRRNFSATNQGTGLFLEKSTRASRFKEARKTENSQEGN